MGLWDALGYPGIGYLQPCQGWGRGFESLRPRLFKKIGRSARSFGGRFRLPRSTRRNRGSIGEATGRKARDMHGFGGRPRLLGVAAAAREAARMLDDQPATLCRAPGIGTTASRENCS